MERAFINRTEAGRLLAEKLGNYANRNDVVVLGCPEEVFLLPTKSRNA